MDNQAKKPFRFMGYTHATPAEVRKVHEHSGLTILQAAMLAGVSADSYKGWLADADSPRYRKPLKPTWLYFIYQLEAIRLGFDGLESLIKSVANQPIQLRKDRVQKTLELLRAHPLDKGGFWRQPCNHSAHAYKNERGVLYTLLGYIAKLWHDDAKGDFLSTELSLEPHSTDSDGFGLLMRLHSPSIGAGQNDIDVISDFFGISRADAEHLFDNRTKSEWESSHEHQVIRLKQFLETR